MKLIDLNGQWWVREAESGERLKAAVPGSVASALLANGKMDDPYFGANEQTIQPIFDKDYEFSRSFMVSAGALGHDRVLLRCHGLDTIAEITLNGRPLGRADNMHRVWEFDAKPHLREGENTISVLFRSPVQYIKDHPSKTGKRFATIRKAACMYGWDWGLCLPDSGIWRDISVDGFDGARIDHVSATQAHRGEEVGLKIELAAEVWGKDIQAVVELRDPEGKLIYSEQKPAGAVAVFRAGIKKPRLWWPAGYGAQPLYRLRTVLQKDGAALDEREQQIGLRTIALNRDKKPGGSNFGFIVNGVPIFFRGSNLVIEDAIISRTTPERWDNLLTNCLRSNLNGIRVWGGAYYPPDYFFEQCDRLGLLVWQDLMFACTFYMPDDAFVENVRHEVSDNLKRIGHHACLALLCGNNEIESLYTVMGSKEPETVALRKLFGREERAGALMRAVVWKIYKKLFLKVLPPLCKTYAPQTSFVHSSPSTRRPRGAKSFFDYLTDGDMHYYLQYNENAPYQKLRTVRCRFMTEMGFQSYPSVKTIAAFTNPEDRSPYSDIMYAHQKCKDGNEAIELYMGRDYLVPKKFGDYVALSQLQAGEIMRYSVEHLRRQSGYCNGMVIWQLNDCWPVVSWSGIDYFGRWKAQQYYTKRFYEPVLLSALDEGASVALWVTNNSPAPFSGTVRWALREDGGALLDQGAKKAEAPAGGSGPCVELDYSRLLDDTNRNRAYLSYSIEKDGEVWGRGTVLFCLAKEFDFSRPAIGLDVAESREEYVVTVSADCFVKGLALDTREGDCVFSDNFFDLAEGERREIRLRKADAAGINSLDALKANLFYNSLNEILLNAAEQ